MPSSEKRAARGFLSSTGIVRGEYPTEPPPRDHLEDEGFRSARRGQDLFLVARNLDPDQG